jgi:hypothetical protein
MWFIGIIDQPGGRSILQPRKRTMVQVKTLNRSQRTRRRSRKWSLLVLAGLPLLFLHLGMLIERALHQETMDAIVVVRWSLAVALLVLFKRMAPQIGSFRSPTLGIAAILIFAVIHLPVAAPEPGLPLAATGFGLALSLAVMDRLCGSLGLGPQLAFAARPASPVWSPLVLRDRLKDRAPPVSR